MAKLQYIAVYLQKDILLPNASITSYNSGTFMPGFGVFRTIFLYPRYSFFHELTVLFIISIGILYFYSISELVVAMYLRWGRRRSAAVRRRTNKRLDEVFHSEKIYKSNVDKFYGGLKVTCIGWKSLECCRFRVEATVQGGQDQPAGCPGP